MRSKHRSGYLLSWAPPVKVVKRRVSNILVCSTLPLCRESPHSLQSFWRILTGKYPHVQCLCTSHNFPLRHWGLAPLPHKKKACISVCSSWQQCIQSPLLHSTPTCIARYKMILTPCSYTFENLSRHTKRWQGRSNTDLDCIAVGFASFQMNRQSRLTS